MSVLWVRELFDDRGGESDGVSHSEEVRDFRVRTTSAYDTLSTIFADSRMPKYLSSHPNNINLLAQHVSGRQEKGAFLWRIQYKYSSLPLPQNIQQRQEFSNPLMRPAIVTGAARTEKAVPRHGYFVQSGAPNSYLSPILNSALDHFDSLPEIDDAIYVVSVEANYLPIPSWVFDYENGTNNAVVMMYGRTFPRGTLKISGMHWSEPKQEQGQWYYTIGFEVHFKQIVGNPIPGWWYPLVDRGFHTYSSGQRKVILNDDGTRPHVPVLLDGNGNKLANASMSNAVYRTWVVYNEVDYSVLPAIPVPPF